jgi:tetratricopeptide (TPR) repeat protein
VAVLAAGLSKETALLVPLVIVAADRRLGAFAPRAPTLVPAGLAGLVFLAGFLATLRSVDYLGGEAYALSFAPAFLAGNLATYLRWCVALADPVRDAVASMDPRALGVGAAVAVAVTLALASQWRAPRHPEEVGAAWFLALLAPVVPLAHHTYLYYLYLPWAGACWLLAGAGERIARRLPPVAPLLLAAVLAFAGTEAWSVRARARALTGTIPADRTVRESTMLRNVTAALDSAGLAPGACIAFVNPAPALHSSLAGGQSGPLVSYLPLETALGRGRALALFFPRLRYLGFSDTLPRAWEDADVFLFQDDGRARHLGRGSRALAELGYFTLRTRQWERAEALFRRSLALGDTLPDAIFGLGATRSALGREDEARRHLVEFLRRWPADDRAAAVAAGLRTAPPGSAPAPVAK